MRNTASPIREFTRDLLLRAGALVAISGSGLDVITEAALSERLGLKEFQPLAFAPDADAPADALLVDYDSPVFDKFGSLVDALGRVTFVDGPSVVLKSIEPVAELARALTHVWVNPATRSVPNMASWSDQIDLNDTPPPLTSSATLGLPWPLAEAAA